MSPRRTYVCLFSSCAAGEEPSPHSSRAEQPRNTNAQVECVMFGNQFIERPFGISVFGSSVMLVEPDIAVIQFSTSHKRENAMEAFLETQKSANAVDTFLKQAGYQEFGSSRIKLESKTRYVDREEQHAGYLAQVDFRLTLRDLDRLEPLLLGIIEAGANEIDSVDYQVNNLAELRTMARQKAVTAGIRKAEAYCLAANVTLGPIIHITDVNPESLQQRSSHGTRFREVGIDEQDGKGSLNPGSINVGGAVMLAFEIGKSTSANS